MNANDQSLLSPLAAPATPVVPALRAPVGAVAASVASQRPLRVLLLTEAAGGGVGKHTLDLAAGLIERDCETHVLYSAGRVDGLFDDRVRSIRGIRTQVVPMARGLSGRDARAIRFVRKYLRQHGPFDVIHAHSSKAGAVARVAAVLAGPRVVYTPHCIASMIPGLNKLARTGVGLVERLLATLTDRIICVSQDERDHIAALGVPARRLTLIPNGVARPAPVNRREVRERLGVDPRAVVVGFVGRLSKQKNVGLLLEAFAKIVDSQPAAQLVVVGSGPEESLLKQQATALGLDSRIVWAGFQNGSECLAAFDVLALPSRYEAMAYVPLEALAAGVPVVATDVGGVRSVVDDGVDGFVVPVDDARALADGIARLVQSSALRAEFSAAGTAKGKTFSLDRMVDATLDLYRSLADGAQPVTARSHAAVSHDDNNLILDNNGSC